VQRLFDNVTPRGITPVQAKLEELLLAYLYSIEEASRYRDSTALKRIKPVNYIIITDGDASMFRYLFSKFTQISREGV
jgi:hypothetical protein